MNSIVANPTYKKANVEHSLSNLPFSTRETIKDDVGANALLETTLLKNGVYSQLDHQYDNTTKSLWFFMKATPRPCYSQRLLSELLSLVENLKIENHRSQSIEYMVAASGVPGIFNLGGDLDTFRKYIQAGAREELRNYAYACVDLVYQNSIGFGQDVTTIALVQGQAMGGGFEAALSAHVIVAEESAKMGFPEILFNLFPGMGAHCFLSRRIQPGLADRIIRSGRSYTAVELYEMGIVDVLAKDGEGVVEVNKFIKQHQKKRNGNLAMQRARQSLHPVTLRELQVITDIWVDAALQLDQRSLRTMERLVNAQNEKPVTCTG